MVIAEQRYTAEEFWEIASLPKNENKRLELEDGKIVEVPESRPLNTIIGSRVNYFLSAFVIPRDLGYVAGADGGYKLKSGYVRQPDTSFIAKERLPEIPARFRIAPDLAVEVVSEKEDILKKTYEYLDSGTQMVWAIYPKEQQVIVFRLDEHGILRGERFGVNDTLDGGDVLPGFTLPVRDIFPLPIR